LHLIHDHGVFGPNSAWRTQITPAQRGKRDSEQADKTPAERHAATSLYAAPETGL